jgi:hypothetical protein
METMKGLAEKAFQIGVQLNMQEDLRAIKQEEIKVRFFNFRWPDFN